MIDEDCGAKTLDALRGVAHDVGQAVRDEGCIDDAVVAAEAEYEKKREGRPMTRRGALIGGAAFLAGMLMWKPLCAFAEYEDLAGDIPNTTRLISNQGDLTYNSSAGHWNTKNLGKLGTNDYGGGASSRAILFTGRWYRATSELVEWKISVSQWLGAATRLTIRCDFSTELYYHITGKLECAPYSYNTYRYKPMWHRDSGDDNCLWLYEYTPDTGTQHIGEEKVCALSNDPVDGSYVKKLHYSNTADSSTKFWAEFQEWDGGSAWSTWIRRDKANVVHDYNMKIWLWNFYWWGEIIGSYDYSPIAWETQACKTTANKYLIDRGLAWAGRILEFAPVADKSMRLDVGAGKTGNGAKLCIWTGNETTKQQFISMQLTDNDRLGCIAFVPVHCGPDAFYIDRTGWDATTEGSYACKLWENGSHRSHGHWIHDESADVQHIFDDSSGYALDRKDGAIAAGTAVQWHCDGYCDRKNSGGTKTIDGALSNNSHKWHITDAKFHLRKTSRKLGLTGLTNGAPASGKKISVEDAATYCYPVKTTNQDVNKATTQVTYQYSWALLDETDDGSWVNDIPDVVGKAYVADFGWHKRDQPANNMIGSFVKRNLGGLQLKLEGAGLSGGIEYQLHPAGGSWPSTWAANGATTGVGKGQKNDQFRCRLTGDIAKKCDVVYWVNTIQDGWGSWAIASNGKEVGTTGKSIQAIRIRIEPKAISGQSFHQGKGASSYTPTDAQAGMKLACFVRCSANGPWKLQYRGTVGAVSASPVLASRVEVCLYVDGKRFTPSGTKNITFDFGKAINIQAAWTNEAKKYDNRDKTCSGFYGWYYDAACKKPWANGVISAATVGTNGKLNLYARNKVIVDYKPTTHARNIAAGRDTYTDSDMTTPGSIEDVPEAWEGWCNDKVPAKLPATTRLYLSDAGEVRRLTCAEGLYAADYASGDKPILIAPGNHPATKSFTYYIDWDDQSYDGFIGN